MVISSGGVSLGEVEAHSLLSTLICTFSCERKQVTHCIREREIRFAISAIMGVLVGIWGGRCGIISYHTTGVVRLFRFIHIVADIKKQARKACMAGGKGDTNTIRMLRS
jgi:hypothetical protein